MITIVCNKTTRAQREEITSYTGIMRLIDDKSVWDQVGCVWEWYIPERVSFLFTSDALQALVCDGDICTCDETKNTSFRSWFYEKRVLFDGFASVIHAVCNAANLLASFGDPCRPSLTLKKGKSPRTHPYVNYDRRYWFCFTEHPYR